MTQNDKPITDSAMENSPQNKTAEASDAATLNPEEKAAPEKIVDYKVPGMSYEARRALLDNPPVNDAVDDIDPMAEGKVMNPDSPEDVSGCTGAAVGLKPVPIPEAPASEEPHHSPISTIKAIFSRVVGKAPKGTEGKEAEPDPDATPVSLRRYDEKLEEGDTADTFEPVRNNPEAVQTALVSDDSPCDEDEEDEDEEDCGRVFDEEARASLKRLGVQITNIPSAKNNFRYNLVEFLTQIGITFGKVCEECKKRQLTVPRDELLDWFDDQRLPTAEEVESLYKVLAPKDMDLIPFAVGMLSIPDFYWVSELDRQRIRYEKEIASHSDTIHRLSDELKRICRESNGVYGEKDAARPVKGPGAPSPASSLSHQESDQRSLSRKEREELSHSQKERDRQNNHHHAAGCSGSSGIERTAEPARTGCAPAVERFCCPQPQAQSPDLSFAFMLGERMAKADMMNDTLCRVVNQQSERIDALEARLAASQRACVQEKAPQPVCACRGFSMNPALKKLGLVVAAFLVVIAGLLILAECIQGSSAAKVGMNVPGKEVPSAIIERPSLVEAPGLPAKKSQ